MIYRFDNCSLDTDRRELVCQGQRVHVEPQVFDVHHYLLQESGRAASREELIQAIWKGRCVSDGAISARIASARRSIGDNGDRQRVIRTVPRFGFRLVSPVTVESSGRVAGIKAASEDRNGRRMIRSSKSLFRRAIILLTIITVTAVGLVWLITRPYPSASYPVKPGPHSIAVMPLYVSDGAEPGRFLAEGLSEELTIELARNADLTVLARSAAFDAAAKGAGAADAAHRLGVQYVLDGTVRRVNDQLVISVMLVNGSNQETVWADRYTAKAETLFEIQGAIVERIVGTLLSSIRETEKQEVLRRPPASLNAYELTLRGVARKHRLNPADALAGIEELRQALVEDPDLASAWMTLGWIEAIEAAFGWRDDVTLDEAIKKIEKAIELDPMLPTAYQALGIAKGFAGDIQGALDAAQRSVELAPGDADNLLFLGRALSRFGRFEEAKEYAQRAMALNPSRPSYYSYNLGRIFWGLEQYQEAMALEQECLTKAPGFTGYQVFALGSAMGSGDLFRAQEYRQMLFDSSPGYTVVQAVDAIGFGGAAGGE
ncbi:winged helix-turn-helix domain-containing tetratricopeptide repeat protein [Marinobacterium sp. YM272]|uniref:winged helix-turn-helix domain-containing tetratricopeptide repeat protein n=1 Tax=Marinobacterium sp. YM272 TaxID=3421654 RepID=UPI003D7F8C31